jgi:hypothetical protein
MADHEIGHSEKGKMRDKTPFSEAVQFFSEAADRHSW